MFESKYYYRTTATGSPLSFQSQVATPYAIKVTNTSLFGYSGTTPIPLESNLLIGTVPNPSTNVNTWGYETSATAPGVSQFSLAPGAGGISVVNALPTFFSAPITVTSVTAANPPVVTTGTNHGYFTGATVWFQTLTGMAQIIQIPFTITVLSPTTFSLNYLDASGFASAATGGTVSLLTNWGNGFLPFDNIITAMTRPTTTTVAVQFSVAYSFSVGQMFQFHIPPQYSGFELMNLNSGNYAPSNLGGYEVISYDATTNTATFQVTSAVGGTTFAYPANSVVVLLPSGQAQKAMISTSGTFNQVLNPTIAYQNSSYPLIYLGSSVCGRAGDYLEIEYGWTANG